MALHGRKHWCPDPAWLDVIALIVLIVLAMGLLLPVFLSG